MTDGVEKKQEDDEKTPRKVIIVGACNLSSSLIRVLLRESTVQVPFTEVADFRRQGKGQRKASRKDRWG